MTAARKTVAALLALLLVLGTLSVLGYMILNTLYPHRPEAPFWSEEDARRGVRRYVEVQMRKRVPPAQLPWILDIKNPENALVLGANVPWIPRPMPGEGTQRHVLLPRVILPTFPNRVAADEPLPAVVVAGSIPWTARTPGERPLALREAILPHLRRKLDADKPEPAMLLLSSVPWVRVVAQVEAVHVPRAHLPVIHPRVEPELPRPAPSTAPATRPAPAATGSLTAPGSAPVKPPTTVPAPAPSSRP